MEPDKINIINSGSKFEGTVEFDSFTRFEGYIRGTLKGQAGSELVLGENGVVEGNIIGDIVIIDGFVRGEIKATQKVIISETGRVVGEIHAPSVAIKFGGYFDGKCSMNLQDN